MLEEEVLEEMSLQDIFDTTVLPELQRISAGSESSHLNTISFSYLTGELRMDALDVSLSAVVLELHTNGPLQSHAHRPSHLFKGGNQLFCLLSTAARVEDGPDVQGNLREVGGRN